MGRRIPTALLTGLLALAACGEGRDDLPPSCTDGPDAVARALADAPGEVRLDGNTRLSECLTSDANGADMQNVGTGFVETAAVLAQRAERNPEGRAALQLGYLVGAAHRGGDGAPGFHTEMLRRLDQEAAAASDGPAFRRGESAGRRSG